MPDLSPSRVIISRITLKPAYTVREVAELTGFSPHTVTKPFENERGVIGLARPEKMQKRGYRTICIPHAVYERVIGRLTVR